MKTRQAAPATAIAMRRRSDQGRSVLGGGLDAVAASLEVGDEAWTQLAPKVVDVDLDRVAGDVILESIPLLLDLSARHQAASLAHQKLDDRVLASGQCGGLTMAGEHALAQVQYHLTHGERRLRTPERPTRDGAQPRPQLIDVEGLDQVV